MGTIHLTHRVPISKFFTFVVIFLTGVAPSKLINHYRFVAYIYLNVSCGNWGCYCWSFIWDFVMALRGRLINDPDETMVAIDSLPSDLVLSYLKTHPWVIKKIMMCLLPHLILTFLVLIWIFPITIKFKVSSVNIILLDHLGILKWLSWSI